MPKIFRKCYFGCLVDGTLHKFPEFAYPHNMDRFNKWKAVLSSSTQERGDYYIQKNIRLCYRHFDEKFRLPSGRLTKNAIPSLNVFDLQHNIQVDVAPTLIGTQMNKPSTSASAAQPIQQVATLSEHKQSHKRSQPRMKRLLEAKLEKLRVKCKTQRRKLLAAKKLAMSKNFISSIDNLSEAAQDFLNLRIRCSKTKPRGRRYTNKEKIVALTILKQSPKAYNLLKKMFVLPSKRCLLKILSTFRLRPGINSNIIENLKEHVKHMSEEKKLINVLFDEVSLAPSLIFNAFQNEVIGFQDNGIRKTCDIADHALVIMIKGVKSKTKQPICFTFSKSGTKKTDLKELLLKIIEILIKVGFKVVATICDQHQTNSAVIKQLKDDTKKKYVISGKPLEQATCFEVMDVKVFPLFDTPHLLKGVRNNLLIKDASFVQNGKEKWARWEHLKMLLAIDVGDNEIRLVNKITESHINKEKLKKMKVKLAAQVFSQRVSSAMRFLARHGVLPLECEDTADFLLIFDKLFDSFNGHSYHDDSKIYKSCVKKKSPHFQLWRDLLPVLESIKFKSIGRNNQIKYESIPSIRNWVHNIKTFIEMWDYLLIHHNVTNLVARNFNQDPLENFFSSIRSNGVRNINPNCNQFMNAFKTLIINNYNSPHSMGANCEQDFNKAM